MFLQRLPRDIRVLLTHEDHSNLQLLAAKADRLDAFGGKNDTVTAAVDNTQEDLVAALPGRNKQHQRGNNKQN